MGSSKSNSMSSREARSKSAGRPRLVAPDEAITVLLIDPSPWSREAYTNALNSVGNNLRVLGFADVSEVDPKGYRGEKTVVVLNLTGNLLNGEVGVALWDGARARLPDCFIVVVSDCMDTSEILDVLERGASGYVPITLELQRVADALRLVAAGGVFMPVEAVLAAVEDAPSFTQLPHDQALDESREPTTGAQGIQLSNQESAVAATLEGMTPREQSVLAHLCKGQSNKVIARELDISEATIKVHVRHIMRKLGVSNRTQVALLVDRLNDALSAIGDVQEMRG